MTLKIEARSQIVNQLKALSILTKCLNLKTISTKLQEILRKQSYFLNINPVTLKIEPKSRKVNQFKVPSMVIISENLKAISEKL